MRLVVWWLAVSVAVQAIPSDSGHGLVG